MRHRAVCLVKLKIDIFYLAAVWNDCLQVHTIHGFCNFLSFCGLALATLYSYMGVGFRIMITSLLYLFIFPFSFFFSHHLPIWYFEWN